MVTLCVYNQSNNPLMAVTYLFNKKSKKVMILNHILYHNNKLLKVIHNKALSQSLKNPQKNPNSGSFGIRKITARSKWAESYLRWEKFSINWKKLTHLNGSNKTLQPSNSSLEKMHFKP